MADEMELESSRIIKKDSKQQILTGVVMEPEVADAHDEITSAEEIQKAMVRFMTKKLSGFGVQHETIAKGITLIENFIAPVDFELEGEKVLKGSWVMSVKVNETEMWERVEKGELSGFSIGAMGIRDPIK